MVLADEFKQLDSEIVKVQSAFADLGLITIREDVKLEECFWSQIPGNFEFIRRRDTINTNRVGGFCRLNRYPQGIASNNHWGEAITILPTLVGSPYFFNFHFQDNGHTIIHDFNSFGDATCNIMMNFFIAQTRKCDARIVVFDRARSADLLFQKMGGHYHSFPTLSHSLEQQRSNLNPFLMEDIPRNRSFLLAWVAMLLAPERGFSEIQKGKVKQAIDAIYAAAGDKRNMAGFAEFLSEFDPALAKSLSRWHGEGVYAGLFDGIQEAFNPAEAMNGFDMNPVVKNKECTLPVFAYLLHRLVSSVDGRPMMIVIYEAWDLLENSFIAPRLDSLLEMLQQNNTAVIFSTSKPLQSAQSYIFNPIMRNCASQIILPDDIAREYNSVAELGINEAEAKRLGKMDRQKGDFFLKQNGETIALRAYLKEMEDIYAVFSNDSKNLAAALGKFSSKK
jgi:type IV secretion system protein VirB4